MPHPLAEVFGFPVDNLSPVAERHRTETLCPFTSLNCTKDKKDAPLGVCSIFNGAGIAITCPQRFKQNDLIFQNAAGFFFSPDTNYIVLPEVRMKDGLDESAGNVDAVLAVVDADGDIADFGSLEIQAVYVSGNIRNPFEFYMEDRATRSSMDWPGPNYPHADYLSSSRKRLAPQILTKGGIFKSWGKKQAIALHSEFFSTLPTLPSVPEIEADIAWFVYDLVLDPTTNTRELTLTRTVYTRFSDALREITTSRPGEIENFKAALKIKSLRLTSVR